MSNIFQKKKLARQAPNLGRLLNGSKFESQRKNNEVENCRRNCVSWPLSLNHPYIYLNELKTFLLGNSINCESSNLIYAVICQGCKE